MKIVQIPVSIRESVPPIQRETKETAFLQPVVNPYRKVALPTMEGITFERVQEIVSLEAQGNYTRIHFKEGRRLLVCKTLRDMENMLKTTRQFVRVHRSYTINLDHLEKYVKGKGGYVIMEGGMNINVSAGKRQHFIDTLSQYFC